MTAPQDKTVPTGTAHFRMVDRVLGGRLSVTMIDLYGESGSWEDVSRRLFADHEIIVTGQTLRRWAKQLGIGEPEAASA